MKYPVIKLFVLAVVICASPNLPAQNIPQLKSGIIKLVKKEKPAWKFVPSQEKRGPRTGSEALTWKFGKDSVEVIIIELESEEKAAEDFKPYDGQSESIPNLGDENYVSPGDPGYNSLLSFRQGKFHVLVNAMTSYRTALRFAQFIDRQIQSTVLAEKWPPEETAVVEFEVANFLGPRTLAAPLDTSRGVGAGGGNGCGGCQESSSEGYSMSVYKITRNEVFLSLSISKTTRKTDKSGQPVVIASKNWNKKFAISRRGITVKDLGDGVKIKARLEKR